MSQTQSQSQASLIDEPTPDTEFSRQDIVTNPFGRRYVVQSQYYSKGGSPMVHLRREHGSRSMYLSATRLTSIIEDGEWGHEPA